jgi:hypothetical protein
MQSLGFFIIVSYFSTLLAVYTHLSRQKCAIFILFFKELHKKNICNIISFNCIINRNNDLKKATKCQIDEKEEGLLNIVNTA